MAVSCALNTININSKQIVLKFILTVSEVCTLELIFIATILQPTICVIFFCVHSSVSFLNLCFTSVVRTLEAILVSKTL